MTARVLRWVLPALLVVSAACTDDGGPGTVRVEITGPVPLGAAALELTGRGILGAQLVGEGWVEALSFQEEGEDRYRVVAVNRTAGALVLDVEVSDVSRRLPRVTVLEASDESDRVLASLGRLEVDVRR